MGTFACILPWIILLTLKIKLKKFCHITRHMNKPSAPASKQKYNDTPGTQARSKTHLDFDY